MIQRGARPELWAAHAADAGILLAAALMLTRRLWLSIDFHMARNYTQSAILSGVDSVNDAAPGLIRSAVKGPDLLTGGKFGDESRCSRSCCAPRPVW